ncbi:MAG: PocR ligand-binding domain-containing protein [Clostridia bacterium]|nr:PocR ligand-binding domain-containing protein [Clostridia bacterium]
MEIQINFEKLSDIARAFYALTKIKMVIFDSDHHQLFSYPDENDCLFCRKMKAIPMTAEKCSQNDRQVFEECRKTGKLKLYTCHAGLVEGCAPLKQNGKIIGYMMFGQISDFQSREVLNQNISYVCRSYGLDEEEFLRAAKSIRLKSYDTIMHAAKIFEACISYIMLNEMLTPTEDKIIAQSERYIQQHLEDVTVEQLCEHLSVSRTCLYDIFRKKTGQGVSGFIRNQQFETAKTLLTNTDYSIGEVAQQCGFSDYNYFSRVFKKRFGISPKMLKNS